MAAMKNLSQLGIKTLLMCFYHCVACVNNRLGGALKQVKALVSKHMFKMYFSRCELECQQYWEAAKVAWSACKVLVARDFARYFEEQWFSGDTANWQADIHPAHGSWFMRNVPSVGHNSRRDIDVQSPTPPTPPLQTSPSPSKKLLRRFRRLMQFALLEGNYFFKVKYCYHLLFALQQQINDVRGMPLPPHPDEASQPRDSLAVAEALG
ncbi:hypothetical protein H257_11112 [Aphanomyces astaci]|uniref:Uncharacterized protein n=1 Tax=Aphanomyces astaci TaxID=112090 RepID=W4G371_APHAT|nr:hypothetical protein H257_11112 [Aphanomyces astaci]ETV74147.1 hypothetical protein H257_11112 [Aphanomyces astaci]|eukprot:XP_009836253.1 hypothetical protein H257_11112 [Aphanomyces astaci]